ncbi:TPA: hypothetical protein DCZ31_00090 [Patescibacteria group bacterium]|nr:hypothetical protein [Candidatus Gracilibacteria bacterium]
MNISSLLEFKEVVNSFCKKFGEKSSFLIEEQFNGKEYRVFIAKTGNYAVLHRDPAYVVGN